MRARFAAVIMALGLASTVVGLVGLAAGWGETRTVARAGTAGRPSRSATTSTTRAPTETPAQFLSALAQAFRDANAAFLFERLHPAVIARYGEPACRTYVDSARDTTSQFSVVSTTAPEQYAWTTDNRTTNVPETLSVTVNRTSNGQTGQAVVHVTAVGERYRWFTDCTPS